MASPAPSVASNGIKRKREGSLPAMSILQAASSPHKFLKTAPMATRTFDNDIVIHLSDAEKYLKEKGTPKSFDEIINFLSIQYASPESLDNLRRKLESRVSKFNVHPPTEDHPITTYTYKPLIPVRNEEELRAYLQKQTAPLPVQLATLKDGWPNCEAALEKMDEAHELYIIRGKGNLIRCVYQDIPTLLSPFPPPFAPLPRMQAEIKLPANPDDLAQKLIKAGIKPTSAPREKPKVMSSKQQRKKAPRKGGRTTNSHMLGLLRDYPQKGSKPATS